MMNKSLNHYLSLPYKLLIIPDAKEGGYTVAYPELPGCITCAETTEGIMANAADAKREWLSAAIEDGYDIPEPSQDTDYGQYSGQFKLRIPKSLHRNLAEHAKAEGISMNQYCLYLLTKSDAEYQTLLLRNKTTNRKTIEERLSGYYKLQEEKIAQLGENREF